MMNFALLHPKLITVLLFVSFIAQAQPSPWQKVQGIPSITCTALHVHGDSIYAAGPKTIYYTHNSGQDWQESALLHSDLEHISNIKSASGKLYLGTYGFGVWVSTNGGANWQADNVGFAGIGSNQISMLAVRGDSLFAATLGSKVFVKNTATNSNWVAYSTGIPWFNVESLTEDRGVLFAGAGGNSTLSINRPGQPDWTETAFDAFNGDPNIFLGAIRQGDVLIGAGNQGLYRSEDDGASWNKVSNGLGYSEFARFARHDSAVFALITRASGLSGLGVTTDQGLSWKTFEPWWTNSTAYDIAFAGNTLYLARADGLYFYPFHTSSVPGAPVTQEAFIGALYPNPATDFVTIPLELLQATEVRIFVYDQAGNLQLEQHAGRLEEGQHLIPVNTRGWPSGAYFVQVYFSSGISVSGRFILRSNP